MNCNSHEFVVFSTEVSRVKLLVQCFHCQTVGTINDPSESEWARAFHAPSHPYPWRDSGRVEILGLDRPYVVPVAVSVPCDCPGKRPRRRQEFERYPGEIGLPSLAPTGEEREDLLALARLALEARGFCSRVFAKFLRDHARETGSEPTGAVRRLAAEIESWSQRGLHFRSNVLAMLLLEHARAGLIQE
jgi:hypothetical protein